MIKRLDLVAQFGLLLRKPCPPSARGHSEQVISEPVTAGRRNVTRSSIDGAPVTAAASTNDGPQPPQVTWLVWGGDMTGV